MTGVRRRKQIPSQTELGRTTKVEEREKELKTGCMYVSANPQSNNLQLLRSSVYCSHKPVKSAMKS